jgi:hypothetical protein
VLFLWPWDGPDDPLEVREDLVEEVTLQGGEVEGLPSALQRHSLVVQLLELGFQFHSGPREVEKAGISLSVLKMGGRRW